MSASVALVGRPNVGKSTLFNALTRTRDALVADLPGLTRDRRYGYAHIQGRDVLVVDTGGLTGGADTISKLVSEQAAVAIEESDLAVLMLDARAGLTGEDQRIADWLRRSGKPIAVAANKVDGLDETTAANEFHALGLGEPILIAAVHRRGVGRLSAVLAEALPQAGPGAERRREDGARVCVVGRPNTGKSTLVNRLAGETRVLAHDMPGTTRDSVEVPFTLDGRPYVLVDTAGIRRRSRISQAVEKFSVVKSLEAIADSDVAIVLLDAAAGMSDQDASLLGLVLEAGRAPVVAVNKWDLAPGDARSRAESGTPAQARLRAVLSGVPRLGPARHGPARSHAPRRRVPPLGVRQSVGLDADAHARGCRHPLAAAARAGPADQAALRSPGRLESPGRRRARQPDGAGPRDLSTLPRGPLPRGVRSGRSAAANRVPHRREPVQGKTQPADPAPATPSETPAAPRLAAPAGMRA